MLENKEDKEPPGKLSQFAENLTPEFLASQSEVYQTAVQINKVFGQGKQRLSELQQTIFDIRPEITRLGGSMQDVVNTISEVSEATKRNVLITAEDAKELFATHKILDDSVENIVSNFEKVGIQFSKIGDEFEKGMNYIQNLGLNTQQIFQSVTQNIEKLNAFNFANGIQGMSKMAATAAMFKFDMSETFEIAKKALSPQGAIELSSAFQRMGVAVGDLTDPFQLMYKSLNDPEGLQESLSQMTKKFSYFDEKTKTFKISPEGILQMRELAEQTSISYDVLSKSSIAAANMDRALKQISPGIKFESEEDKKLIANIARMDKSGQFEIKVPGQEQAVKLAELNKDQIAKLLEEQKEAPKTIEDTAKSQLDAQKLLNSEVSAIRETLEAYIGSQKPVVELYTQGDKFFQSLTSRVAKVLPDPSKSRAFVGDFRKEFGDSITKLFSGKLTDKEKEEEGKKLEAFIDKYKNAGGEELKNFLKGIRDDFKSGFSDYKKYGLGIQPDKKTKVGTTVTKPTTTTTTTTNAGQPLSQSTQTTQPNVPTSPTSIAPSYQLPDIKPINQRPSVSNIVAKTGVAAATTKLSTQNNTQNTTTNTTNNNQQQKISNTSTNNYSSSGQQVTPQTYIPQTNQQTTLASNQQPIQATNINQPALTSSNVKTTKVVMNKPTVNIQAGPATISQVDLAGTDKQSKPTKEPVNIITPSTNISTDMASVYNDNKKTDITSNKISNLNQGNNINDITSNTTNNNQQPIQATNINQPSLTNSNVTTTKVVMNKPDVNVQAGPATISQVDLAKADKQTTLPKESAKPLSTTINNISDTASTVNDNKKTDLLSINTKNLNNTLQNNSLTNTTNQVNPVGTPTPVINLKSIGDVASLSSPKEDRISKKEPNEIKTTTTPTQNDLVSKVSQIGTNKPNSDVIDFNKIKEKNIGKTSLTEVISEQNFVDFVKKELTSKEKMTSNISKFEKILTETKKDDTEVAKNLIQQQKISKKPEIKEPIVEPITQSSLVGLKDTKKENIFDPKIEKQKSSEPQIVRATPEKIITPIQAGFDQKQKKEMEEITANVNLGGNVRFEIVTTPQTDTADMEKYVNSPEFKNKFYSMLLNIDNSQRINIRNTLGIG